MNEIQTAKKFQLFLVVYDSRADARLDDALEKPLRAARSPHPSPVVFGNIKNEYDVLTKVSTRKHFSEYAHLLK